MQPAYPAQAKKFRIQGTVKLKALIGKDGSVVDIELIDGHPALVDAAIEAVKQCRYKPMALGGRPVQVLTQIHVKFGLKG